MKITQEDRLVLVGLASLVIEERKQLDKTESGIVGFLKKHGVEERSASNWAGELVYNEGDDPVVAADSVLKALDIEVEE